MFRDDEDYEKYSRILRSTTGVDDRFCPDVLYMAYQLVKLGWISEVRRVPDEEMPDDFASYQGSDRILRIPDRTFFALDQVGNASMIERRGQRFTLAHEFAHIVQNESGIRYRGPSGDLAKRVDLDIRVDEIRANRFAAAVLIPAHLASSALDPEHLSELFDVNIRVSRIRQPQLERLQRRAANELRGLPDSVFDHLQARRKQGFKVTSLDIEIERRRREALALGHLPEACESCGKFTLKRENGQVKCKTCASKQ